MSVERKDLFGDGKVSIEYYPHKRVELRVADFKIVVSKAYGSKTSPYGTNYTLDKPSIQMSSNQTVFLDIESLNLIYKSINKAIQILNAENDGLSIDNNFSLNQVKYIKQNEIPQEIINIQKSEQNKKIKSIPYKDIDSSKVYTDIKGHEWIYLGEGKLIANGSVINRSGCSYIYLNFDIAKRYGYTVENNTIKVNDVTPLLVDTYASKKRFIRSTLDLEQTILRIEMKYTKYSIIKYR